MLGLSCAPFEMTGFSLRPQTFGMNVVAGSRAGILLKWEISVKERMVRGAGGLFEGGRGEKI